MCLLHVSQISTPVDIVGTFVVVEFACVDYTKLVICILIPRVSLFIIHSLYLLLFYEVSQFQAL